MEIVMETYVLDTVALARYFEDDLPRAADKVFRLAEEGRAELLVPSVVVGEFIYSVLKGRLKVADINSTIIELLQIIQVSEYLHQVDMTLAEWQKFLILKIPELHDRMICAVAAAHGATIVTNDLEIKAEGINTVW
jgi:predicted nucleic acid-binding protein